MNDLSELIISCPGTFDETLMFKGKDSLQLKRQFKEHFKNISIILDCVTCEKCKLWGKLQINGLGTALKILFENSKEIQLERTEIVALFNTLRRLSESIKWSNEMINEIKMIESSQQMNINSNNNNNILSSTLKIKEDG